MNQTVFSSNSPGLTYQGTWTTKRDPGYPNGSAQVGTLQDDASVFFRFTGTAVYVFADVNIDADLRFDRDELADAADFSTTSNPSAGIQLQCVYALEGLPPMSHTIFMTPTSTPHHYPGSALILSSIIYTDTSTPSSSSSSSSSPSLLQAGAIAVGTASTIPGVVATKAASVSSSSSTTSSASSLTSAPSTTSSGPSTGAIIGIVAGVLALVILILRCWRLYLATVNRPRVPDIPSMETRPGLITPILAPSPSPGHHVPSHLAWPPLNGVSMPKLDRPIQANDPDQWFRQTFSRDYDYVLSQYAPYRTQLCDKIRGVISEPLRNRIKDAQNTFEAMEMLFAAEITQNQHLQRVVVDFAWEKDDLRLLLRDWLAIKQ